MINQIIYFSKNGIETWWTTNFCWDSARFGGKSDRNQENSARFCPWFSNRSSRKSGRFQCLYSYEAQGIFLNCYNILKYENIVSYIELLAYRLYDIAFWAFISFNTWFLYDILGYNRLYHFILIILIIWYYEKYGRVPLK